MPGVPPRQLTKTIVPEPLGAAAASAAPMSAAATVSWNARPARDPMQESYQTAVFRAAPPAETDRPAPGLPQGFGRGRRGRWKAARSRFAPPLAPGLPPGRPRAGLRTELRS